MAFKAGRLAEVTVATVGAPLAQETVRPVSTAPVALIVVAVADVVWPTKRLELADATTTCATGVT